MDYKFRQNGLVLSAVIVLMVVSIVVIANWRTISRSLGRTQSNVQPETTVAVSDTELSVEEVETIKDVANASYDGKQLGNNLYAWRNDDAFFDSDITLEEVEKRIVTEVIPAKTKRNEETLREEQ